MSDINQIIIGAAAIAKSIGIKPHQVYNLQRKGNAPIRNCEGLGLVADPQELKAWILGKHLQNTAL